MPLPSIVCRVQQSVVTRAKDAKTFKSFLFNNNISFNEKMESYRNIRNITGKQIPEQIDVCLMMANTCSSAKKEAELAECLNDLKLFTSKLESPDINKVTEKSWNNMVQLFARQEKYEKYALLWFDKIKTQKVAQLNMFTLSTILKPLANAGDLQSCESVVKTLKGESLCNVFTFSYYVKACINSGNFDKVVSVLNDMKEMNIEPNHLVFSPILKESIRTNKLDIGMIVCEMILNSKLESMELSMAVASFFLKAGKADKAINQFHDMKKKYQMDVISWTCLIQAYIETGQNEKAVQSIFDMKQQNIAPDSKTFSIIMKSCANSKLFKEGKILHELAKKTIKEFPVELSTSIISFYTKCGEPEIAIEECEKLKKQGKMDIILWNCLIQAYIETGQNEKAVQSIFDMKQQNITPDSKTFSIIMKSCANSKLFKEGKILHELAKKTIKEFPVELSTSIISFYTKCGEPEIAIEECEKLKKQGKMDIVLWNCLIKSQLDMRLYEKAVQSLSEMQNANIQPDSTIFSLLIQYCTKNKMETEGKETHRMALTCVKRFTPHLHASICAFYTKCGKPEIAIEECEKLKKQGKMDVVLWNCLIQAYAELDVNRAIEVLKEMQDNNIKPDSVTFSILVTACANSKLFKEGKILHELAKKTIKEFPVELSTSIISFYTKCGEPEIAIEECEKLKEQGKMNIVLWTCLIQAYAELDVNRAIEVLKEMQDNNIKPDSTVFAILITACANADFYKEGKILHELAKKTIKEFPVKLSTSIISFYTKCGEPEIAIEECEKLKKQGSVNIVLWNCLIQAYAELDVNRAIEVLKEMQDNNIKPDSVTFSILITACANADFYKEGKILHELAKKTIKEFPVELSTSIISFYTKCGEPEIAIEECEKLKKQGKMDIILWNCLIQAFLKQNDIDRAIEQYKIMKDSCKPDIITYIVLLSGCAELVSADKGHYIIQEIKFRNLDTYEDVKSVMAMFYSKIGDVAMAQQLFNDLHDKEKKSNQSLSLNTYNNMLATYAIHGKADMAIKLFKEMMEKAIVTNDQTFTNVLTALSHSGLVEEAETIFKKIITPSIYNVGAMIDVYARSGIFDKAESLITDRSNFVLWNTIMSGCRKFNNIELGERIFKILISIDPKQASPYLLMAHIYTYHNMNQKADQIRDLMVLNGIKKIPGIVYHEENGRTYKFISGSPESEKQDIVMMREEIYRKIIKAGFQPDTRWVTNPKILTEKEKVDSLCRHAEKTAIAHAFVLNPNRQKILLRKNLRVCNDCHNATEFISKVMKVEIIVRDANRYHHFKDGKCSCNGYW